MNRPFFRETVLRTDIRVENALGVTVATFGSADLAWAYVAEEEPRRGPLTVREVATVERSRALRRLSCVRAA